MSELAGRLAKAPFSPAPIPCRHKQYRAVQVTLEGLRLLTSTGSQTVCPKSWHFTRNTAFFDTFSLRFSPANLDLFRRQFNLMRMRGEPALQECPDCGLLSPAQSSPVRFCPECLSMFQDGESLCHHKGYYFNFCEDGTFACIGRKPMPLLIDGRPLFRSLRQATRPIFERLTSHIFWILVAIALMFWFPRIGTGLLFLSLGLSFSYLILLYFRGALRRLPQPPPGPGPLVNEGRLDEARALCPAHPLFLR